MVARRVSSPDQGELFVPEPVLQAAPPIEAALVPDRAELIKKHVTGRAAFMRVMFPGEFGIDENELRDAHVSEDAYRESNAAAIRGNVYRYSPQSLRQFQRTGRWVLLTASEHSRIINYPHAYAQGGDVKNRTTLRAHYRDYDERMETATRAGGHTLERPYQVMSTMVETYAQYIDRLRYLQRRMKYHWQANSTAYDLRRAAMGARDGLRDTLEAIASVKGWSEDDLKQVRTGLDKRLLSGRGQQELMRKKTEWSRHVRTLGNYTIAKKVLVRDRAERAKAEIDARLGQEATG